MQSMVAGGSQRLLKEDGQPFFALPLYFFHYNFCRIHKSLRVSPAMEAGITDHLWTMEELVEKMDALRYPSRPRGPYKKWHVEEAS